MNILVVGYFGFKTNQLDGQTTKTRDVYALIKQKSSQNVSFFDTQSFQESKINLLKMLFQITKSDTIFYLPAHNNLKYVFPLIYAISKVSYTKINYIVVGGWLAEFLKYKPFHSFLLKRINGIYTETNDLYLKLKKIGFDNIYSFHNFRLVNFPNINTFNIARNNPKLVFMARVHPLKGVDLLFRLKKTLEEKGLQDITIDIYGPIYEPYRDEFFTKLKNSNITYNGALQPEQVHSTLTRYDLMLFPTKYYTEGFPGTILDSYISGLPVIVTDWLNAKEFVVDGQTGYITPFDNEQEFINKTIEIINNPSIMTTLRENIVSFREKYSSNAAWNILKDSMIE